MHTGSMYNYGSGFFNFVLHVVVIVSRMDYFAE